jgi:hypothetical protein
VLHAAPPLKECLEKVSSGSATLSSCAGASNVDTPGTESCLPLLSCSTLGGKAGVCLLVVKQHSGVPGSRQNEFGFLTSSYFYHKSKSRLGVLWHDHVCLQIMFLHITLLDHRLNE